MPTTAIVLMAGLGALGLAAALWIIAAILSFKRARRIHVQARKADIRTMRGHSLQTRFAAGGGLQFRARHAAEAERREADWDFRLDASLPRSARRRTLERDA